MSCKSDSLEIGIFNFSLISIKHEFLILKSRHYSSSSMFLFCLYFTSLISTSSWMFDHKKLMFSDPFWLQNIISRQTHLLCPTFMFSRQQDYQCNFFLYFILYSLYFILYTLYFILYTYILLILCIYSALFVVLGFIPA